MRLRMVVDATLVSAAVAVAALVAAPVGSAATLQVVVLLAIAVSACVLLSARQADGTIGCPNASADIVGIGRKHGTRAPVAPLSVSLRLRC